MNGVVYVVYGEAARREAAASVASLRAIDGNNDYPVAIVGEGVSGVDHIAFVSPFAEAVRASRWAKLNLDRLSPFRYTLYLDADTRLKGDLAAGFKILADGWDMVIAPSGRQGGDVMGHLPQDERIFTLATLRNPLPLQWQAGVFYFKRERAGALFAAWREAWQRFKGQDQGALLRALAASSVRVWTLGEVWNRPGGEVVDHLFGRARGGN